MGDLTVNFSRKEFACKCGCGADHIDLGLVYRLQAARFIAGVPFVINSGVRCKEHNSAFSSPTSSHIPGYAVDIACNESRSRFKIIDALLKAGFERIGIRHDFIHADVDPEKPAEVMWDYNRKEK